MRVGVVREVKAAERRVALTPAGTRALIAAGHRVLVEQECGVGAGWGDVDYQDAGAEVVDAEEAWSKAELMLKVKEPMPEEYPFLREDLTLFTYLHLAPAPELTEALVGAGTRAIAYETVTGPNGGLPLLRPMSEIAGRLAAQAGADCLRAPDGGPGLLAGGIPGVAAARFLILGGGVVGAQAAAVALGLGADVTVLERSLERMRYLDERWEGRLTVLMSDELTLGELLGASDVVIGAVLIPGATAPTLIQREMLGEMKAGSVLVDVAIDQGGCFETSEPTTHEEPTYVVDGIQHYCVANMPGAVPVTSTSALTQATLPFVLALAAGPKAALETDAGLAAGLNVEAGRVVNPVVAAAYEEANALSAEHV
jgi:alanine dehydrogenase